MPTPLPEISVTDARRGEPRHEDQIGCGGIIQGIDGLGVHHTLGLCYLAYPGDVEPGTVIFDNDFDLIALQSRFQRNAAGRGFPGALSRRRILKSMIDGIPQHVQQRLKEAIYDRLVGFGSVVRNRGTQLLSQAWRQCPASSAESGRTCEPGGSCASA